MRSSAGRAICVFDAETASDVAAVNKMAGLPVTSIDEAIELRIATDLPPGEAGGFGTTRPG